MEFAETFFEGEEREGFFVEGMMKRAWAAQLEVLKEIERICQKYELTYYATWGTLLGAVRHKGFIPWDDDIDITMKREDYEKFIKAAEQELPREHILVGRMEKEWDLPWLRIVNSKGVNFEKEHLKKYHGCPYVVGIDIFPMDYLSRDPKEEQLQCELIKLLVGVRQQIGDGQIDEKEKEEYLTYIEEFSGIRIERNNQILEQLTALIDRASQMYREDESDAIAELYEYAMNNHGRMKKEWYDAVIWLPFENTTIPVPQNYDECLKSSFGEDYMTPRQILTHDYPFYKKQAESILEKAKTEQQDKK